MRRLVSQALEERDGNETLPHAEWRSRPRAPFMPPSGAWIDGGGCSVSITRPLLTELFACGLQRRARFKVRCAAWSAKLWRSGMGMKLCHTLNGGAGPVLHSCRPLGLGLMEVGARFL